MASRLERIERKDRGPAVNEIAHSVQRHLEVLNTEAVAQCACIMVDDLYRSGGNLTYWDESIPDYLRASVRPLLQRLTALGYALHYFIDNEYEPTPLGLALPVEWAPLWFGAAGFSYVSPQEVALRLIKSAGRKADPWTDALPDYLPDARIYALDALERCRVLVSHLVYLDTESHEKAADLAFQSTAAGEIVVFRNQAPHLSAKTNVRIVPPQQRTL